METDRHLSTSARTALQILGLFSVESPNLGVSEIGRRMGLPKSNVSRLVASLVSEGFLSRTPAGRYRLGLRLQDLASIVSHTHELYGPALDALIELHQATGESSHVAVLCGLDVVHLERLLSDYVVRRFTQDEQFRSPIHATSTGKVLLAFGSDVLRERAIARGLPRLTPATITDPDRFRADLDAIREQGWAVCREEWLSGISSVAFPVLDARRQAVAALAVVGASHTLTDARIKSFLPTFRRAAAKVAQDDAFAIGVHAIKRGRLRVATAAT
jgi:DNA-binding IclR family transcriptional regulator